MWVPFHEIQEVIKHLAFSSKLKTDKQALDIYKLYVYS